MDSSFSHQSQGGSSMLVLTFQIGDERVALDVRQVRAVVPRIRLRPLIGAPGWLAGLFVYHGQVVPVVDLHRLLERGECSAHLSSRIILVPRGGQGGNSPPGTLPAGERDHLLGLLAAQVAEVREVEPTEAGLPRLIEPEQPELGDPVVDSGGILHLLDLDRLLPGSVRGRLALAEPGASV
jgi:chemotaxis-related protein WspB